MTIEIQQSRLEAMIQQRMASGHFQTVEDLLLQMLETSPSSDDIGSDGRKSLAQLFAEFPFMGMDIEFPRDNSPMGPVARTAPLLLETIDTNTP